MNDLDINEITMEELVAKREEAILAMEDISAGIQVFNDEILHRLTEMKVNGTVVGDKTVSKVTRVSFGTSLEDARSLEAVKTIEKIDEAKLRQLHNAGATVPGTRVTEYVMIKDINKVKGEDK